MTKRVGYRSRVQEKNLGWYLPRPGRKGFIGGMPLNLEAWLMELAGDLSLDHGPLRVLQPFGGAGCRGIILDIRKTEYAMVQGDAHNLPIKSESVDVVLADPPFTNRASEFWFKTGKIVYRTWSREAVRVLKPGGILIVYHQFLLPSTGPGRVNIIKRVFVGSRTFHAPKVAVFYRKKGNDRHE